MKNKKCNNCQHPFSGKYCSNCGQRDIANRKLRFSDVTRDFIDNVFNIHTGLFFTFWNLIIRPGMVGVDYLEGQRKTYTHPIRYLIIAVALQAFLDYWFIHPELTQQPDFIHFPFLSAAMNKNMAIWNITLATKYAFIHNLTMILVFPLSYILLFRKQGYNFTELLTVNFFYFSTGLILTVSTIFIFDQFIEIKLPIPFIILITLGYVVWSTMGFFHKVNFWRRLIKIFIALVFFMVIRVFLLVYLLSLFFPFT